MRTHLAFSQKPCKQKDNRVKHLKYRKNNTNLECHISDAILEKWRRKKEFRRRQKIQVIYYQETHFVRCQKKRSSEIRKFILIRNLIYIKKERTVYMQPRDKIHRHKNTKLGKEARGIYSKWRNKIKPQKKNWVKIRNLPDNDFWVMTQRVLNKLKRRMNENTEKFNRALENIKNKFELKN